MRLATTYLNERIELFEGVYDLERQATLQSVPRLYNRMLGPVTTVHLQHPELLDLSLYSSACKHSAISALMSNLAVRPGINASDNIPGGGKGSRLSQALLGGLGEIAERLLAILHFEAVADQLLYATHEELVRQGHRALGPDDLALFAEEQYRRPRFPYVPFRHDTRIGWIMGHELLTGEAVLLPAQLLLLYYKARPTEARIGYSTTGGLAFHPDRRHAILHGLYEFVERDAINLRWYCHLPPPRVEVNLLEQLASHFGLPPPRLSTPFIDAVRIYLNTLDVPLPVLTAIAINRSRSERSLLAGGGAWSLRERALAQAVFEVGQSINGLKFFKSTGVRADSDVATLTEFFEAEVYYGYAENLPRLSWYTAGEQVIPWESVPTFQYADEEQEFEATMCWLQTTTLKPIVLDFSSACWPGVAVMKVFIPQLTQASIPAYPYLGHARFYTLPQQMGMADRRLTFSDLTADPLPFP